MQAKYRKRILALAKALRAIPPEHFDMGSWYSSHEGYVYSDVRQFAAGVAEDDLRDDLRAGQLSPTKAADIAAHSCKTAACVAGWCTLLFPRSIGLAEKMGVTLFLNHDHPGADARAYLGLGSEAAEALFCPPGFDVYEYDDYLAETDRSAIDYTPELAAATLERLATTGVVQWWPEDEPVAWNA
jgi:hypothetical protein